MNWLDEILANLEASVKGYTKKGEARPLTTVETAKAAIIKGFKELPSMTKKEHTESDRNIAYREGWNDHIHQLLKDMGME